MTLEEKSTFKLNVRDPVVVPGTVPELVGPKVTYTFSLFVSSSRPLSSFTLFMFLVLYGTETLLYSHNWYI